MTAPTEEAVQYVGRGVLRKEDPELVTGQARFVDDPSGAIAEGDRLVEDLMRTRGYPVGKFQERIADISVDHPRVVEHYRAAHAIANASADGRADTEDLRQAMVHLRALFEDLLEIRDEIPPEDETPRWAEGGRR